MLETLIRKLQNYILEKEEEMVKHCNISSQEIEDEIRKVLLQIRKLRNQCNDDLKEFEYLLAKLHWIKAEAIKCQNELEMELKD